MIPTSLSLASSLVMLFTMLSSPVVDPQYKTAANTTFTAILELPDVKENLNLISKNGEHIFWKYSPLTEKQLAYTAYLYPMVTGQITTKPMTNLKYVTRGGITIRPEIEFNYRTDQSLSALLTLTKGF